MSFSIPSLDSSKKFRVIRLDKKNMNLAEPQLNDSMIPQSMTYLTKIDDTDFVHLIFSEDLGSIAGDIQSLIESSAEFLSRDIP